LVLASISLEGLGLAIVGEPRLDAELRQGVGEQIVRAPIQRAGGDDVVPRFADGQDGVGDGGLTGGERQRRDAAFERSEALLQDVLRRVHDARVDVAGHLEVE
jgi:hypothetical protein